MAYIHDVILDSIWARHASNAMFPFKWHSRPKASSTIFAFQIQQQESHLNIKRESRFNTRWESRSKNKWGSCLNFKRGSRLHWSLCLKKTSTTVASSSTRIVFSLPKKGVCLCFCNQFSSTLVKTINNTTGSTVHWQDKKSLDRF